MATAHLPASRWADWTALAGFLAVCFAVAGFGSLFSPDEWYRNLAKPSFNPPGWIFGPVWTVLYALMAIAAWLVWRRRDSAPTWAALNLFGLQLVLNGAWSWLFFGLHRSGWAFADIVLMWCAIAATLVMFWRVSRTAGLLFVPYLAWVSFAAVLNYSFWQLNR